MQDTRTVPIVALQYTQGNRFTHYLIGTFEIPDGVVCQELTVDNARRSSTTFRSYTEFRVDLAAGMDVSPTKFKSGYFSGSTSARYVEQNAFAQDRFYSKSERYYNLYSCRLIDLETSSKKDSILDATTGLSPERMVAYSGTHIIGGAEFGGYLSASAFISSCVLSSFSASQVSAEVEASVLEVSASGSYTSACSVFNEHATFEGVVGGGDKNKIAFDRDTARLEEWLESIPVSPTTTRRFLLDMSIAMPEWGTYVDDYSGADVVLGSGNDDSIVVPDNCPELECAPLPSEEEESPTECIGVSNKLYSCIRQEWIFAGDVQVGDQLQLYTEEGASVCSEVYYTFRHDELATSASRSKLIEVEVRSDDDHKTTDMIRVSKNHLLYVQDPTKKAFVARPARELAVGDVLRTWDGSVKVVSNVSETAANEGLVNILTLEGSLALENGIVVSSHAYHETLYWMFFYPLRVLYWIGGSAAMESIQPVLKFMDEWLVSSGIRIVSLFSLTI